MSAEVSLHLFDFILHHMCSTLPGVTAGFFGKRSKNNNNAVYSMLKLGMKINIFKTTNNDRLTAFDPGQPG